MAHSVERLLGLTLGSSGMYDRFPAILFHKYVDENGVAVMLAAKRSGGVALELNLNILLCTDDKARGITLAPRPNVTSPKHGYQSS